MSVIGLSHPDTQTKLLRSSGSNARPLTVHRVQLFLVSKTASDGAQNTKQCWRHVRKVKREQKKARRPIVCSHTHARYTHTHTHTSEREKKARPPPLTTATVTTTTAHMGQAYAFLGNHGFFVRGLSKRPTARLRHGVGASSIPPSLLSSFNADGTLAVISKSFSLYLVRPALEAPWHGQILLAFGSSGLQSTATPNQHEPGSLVCKSALTVHSCCSSSMLSCIISLTAPNNMNHAKPNKPRKSSSIQHNHRYQSSSMFWFMFSRYRIVLQSAHNIHKKEDLHRSHDGQRTC